MRITRRKPRRIGNVLLIDRDNIAVKDGRFWTLWHQPMIPVIFSGRARAPWHARYPFPNMRAVLRAAQR